MTENNTNLIYLAGFFLIAPFIIWGGIVLIACLPVWVFIVGGVLIMLAMIIDPYNK